MSYKDEGRDPTDMERIAEAMHEALKSAHDPLTVRLIATLLACRAWGAEAGTELAIRGTIGKAVTLALGKPEDRDGLVVLFVGLTPDVDDESDYTASVQKFEGGVSASFSMLGFSTNDCPPDIRERTEGLYEAIRKGVRQTREEEAAEASEKLLGDTLASFNKTSRKEN